jgi:hypothetical protein
MQYNVKQFGATGDGATNDTASLQATLDRCSAEGGGTVTVPAGNYVTGSLWLRSNLTLHVQAGATLLGSRTVDDFPVWTSKWEGPGVKPGRAALLCGEGLDNVAVTGRGTIDGRGDMWWDSYRAAPGKLRRPFLCRFVDCRNVLIEGVTFRNSPMWTVSPLACDNVTISRITVVNPPDSPNTDGINPDSCRNVRISDCHVDVGDDCITIKSGKEDEGRRQLRPCENITVTNCTLEHGHGGVVIGSEMSGSIRNVTISNCIFVGTDRGIRIKARRGRGGVVEDVRASDLVMDRVLCPIVLNLFYGCGAWGDPKVEDQTAQPVNEGTPRFRRLRFSNITARRIQYAAAYMVGLPEMFNEDVICENCSFFMDPDCTTGGAPAMAPGVADHCRAGVIARSIKRLTLRNIDISDQLGPAITISGAKDLQLSEITLRTASDGPLVILDDVASGHVRGCCTPPSVGLPVRIAGTGIKNVTIEDDRYEVGTVPVGQL